MRRLSIAAGAVLVLGAGCGGGDATGPAGPSDVVITMVRTACFGTCPDYKLTIKSDGAVTFEGRQHVAVDGFQTAQVDPADVESLVGEFYDIDFFSLHDSYECPITDLPSTITSITTGGATKTVRDYGNGLGDASCAAPQDLVELEDRIDQVAESARWVEGP